MKMSLDCQNIRFTDDHTLESASEVLARLQLDRRIPQGREAYQGMLENLNFQSCQATGNLEQRREAHSQFVFQGQCLVLGDSGAGKTSLVNSLTGKPFNAEEPKTKGVEQSLVDRKWRKLDPNAGLKFGEFTRFCENLLVSGTLFGPQGFRLNMDQDIISVLDLGSILCRFGLIVWMLSVMYSIFFGRDSLGVCIWSCTLAIATKLLRNAHSSTGLPLYLHAIILLVSSSGLRGFFIGLLLSFHVRAYLLDVPFSLQNCCSDQLFIPTISSPISIVHFFTVAFFIHCIVVLLFLLITKYVSILPAQWQSVESTNVIPGQAKFTNVKSLLARLGLYPLIVSVFSGACFGLAVQSLTDISAKNYCCLIHLMTLSLIFHLVASQEVSRTQLALIFIYFEGIHIISGLFEYYSQAAYATIAACYFCQTVYLDWLSVNSILGDIEEKNYCFTLLVIQKVTLNYQKLKRALNNWFSSLKLTILDFAGDKEYYAYHHMFLRSKAFYVIVFNMAYLTEDNFRSTSERIKRISFWLESVCAHAGPRTPIFLVGSHRGNANQTCINQLNAYLHKSLWNLFCDELVINDKENLLYFPIENSQGQNDKGIQNLQNIIMLTAHSTDYKMTMGCNIPFSWIKIQDAILCLRENPEAKSCVTLEEFPLSFGNFICSNWSKETLKYFHEKGLLIYVDKEPELCKWVLLKPQVLVDIIIMLVLPPPDLKQPQGFRRDWILLHDTGMLRKSLLQNILASCKESEKPMTAFLEEYDLICPLSCIKGCVSNSLKPQEQFTHFVPSLLPLSTDANRVIWNDDPTDKRFYVFLERFLPHPLFYHLLSRAYKHSVKEFKLQIPIIYRDVGVFWMNRWQPYRLALQKDENMIEVTFSCSSKSRMKPSDVLVQVFTIVEDICNRDFPFVNFHCGPACPSQKCPGHQDGCLPNPVGEERATRPHVFNVMPARKKATASSFYCLNHNFEDVFKEWEP